MNDLILKINKKYRHMVRLIELEADLIDDCPYLVYLNDNYEFDEGQTFIAKNFKEINEFLSATKEIEKETISTRFYEGTLRSRAVEFLYVNNRNYKDESEIKKHTEGFRRIDQSKAK
jgi:hypothetical protein